MLIFCQTNCVGYFYSIAEDTEIWLDQNPIPHVYSISNRDEPRTDWLNAEKQTNTTFKHLDLKD